MLKRLFLIWMIGLCITTACAGPAPDQPQSDGSEKIESPVPEIPTPTPTSTPILSPAYSGVYTGTPTPNPTPETSLNGGGVKSYIVQPGETLGLIAAVFGCSVEEVVAMNELSSADSIRAGQTLYIPVTAADTGPYLKLIPDSELIYGPAYIHFDLADFVAGQAGYLVGYTEEVEGRTLTGVEILRLVSQRFSVGPRVLLTLLELRSRWVTQLQPSDETLIFPLGRVQEHQAGLFQQLSWAAVRLNQGYYGWKRGDRTTALLANGVRVAFAPRLNPGTAGVQHCLAALSADEGEWLRLIGPTGFAAIYEQFFGNPFAYTVEPLMTSDLAQPELRLPWETGHTWYFTGGPHGGWGSGSGRAALDFAPGDKLVGCTVSPEWIVAAAPGLVLRSENGEVLVDLDGDGFEQSGWVLLYMHVAAEDRVEVGATLERGQRMGHPSCEGGFADATHLHFARRYNGEWVPAGSGPAPMILSGWMAHRDVMPYDGTLTRGDEERTACECWDDQINGLTLGQNLD